MPTRDDSRPVIVAICCVCDQVEDDEADSRASGWVPLPAYLHRHQATLQDILLSHTYCPSCYTSQARAWHLSTADRVPPRAA